MTETNLIVIDDEAGIREGCKRALRPRGYMVETAENGEEALSKVRAGWFDLALIDIMMPGTSGIDLIAQIHQHDPEIVCIIITGYATVELAVRAIKQGAYDFLTKPFTTDDLLLVVDQGLERRRLSLETKRLQKIEAEAEQLAMEKARLEELDRAKVAFIRLVTHELQTPISAILTYIDMILHGYVESEQLGEYLQRIQERGQEQLALITDLLEFGQLKEARTIDKFDWVQVEDCLRQVIAQFEPQATEKGLALSIEISSGLPPVWLAPDQAKSIWRNLLSNALKYTPAGGAIQVRLTKDEAGLVGAVSDTGIGIPQEAQPQLFTEFFRARNAKDLNIPGTGLGLAIVKQIVEKGGGKIWVESEASKGSTFTFSLPVGKSAEQPIASANTL